MNTIEQSYYLDQLSEQMYMLVDACHEYDKGKFYQAKNMSAIIRTLVKDPENINLKRKNQTISLLKSLGVKDTMKFYNTGYEAIDPLINISLVGILSAPSSAPLTNAVDENIYLPVLNNSELIDVKWITFEDWWNSKVIVSKCESHEITFTRKKISLTMAEQAGGVHVDSFEKIDKDYRDVLLNVANIFVNISQNGQEYPIKHLQYALVRQISHELIISISKQFNLLLNYQPTNKHNLRGLPERNIKQFGVFAQEKNHLSKRTKTPVKGGNFSSFTPPSNAAYVKIQF